MARRRYGRRRGGHRRSFHIIPIGILIAQGFVANAGGGDAGAKVSRFLSYYIGLDASSGVFDTNALKIGYLPWLVYGGAKFGMSIIPQMNPNRSLPKGVKL